MTCIFLQFAFIDSLHLLTQIQIPEFQIESEYKAEYLGPVAHVNNIFSNQFGILGHP